MQSQWLLMAHEDRVGHRGRAGSGMCVPHTVGGEPLDTVSYPRELAHGPVPDWLGKLGVWLSPSLRREGKG